MDLRFHDKPLLTRVGLFVVEKNASGGKVCHLESWLANAPSLRSSGSSHSLMGCAHDLELR